MCAGFGRFGRAMNIPIIYRKQVFYIKHNENSPQKAQTLMTHNHRPDPTNLYLVATPLCMAL